MYSNFESLNADELTIVRKGLFSPVLEVTDGELVYGKVTTSHNKGLKSLPLLETATEVWTVKRESILGDRTLTIYNSKDENVGSMTDGDRLLKLGDGFEVTLKMVGGGRTTVKGGWHSDKYGDLIEWKQSAYSYKKPYSVIFQKTLFKTIPEMPLLLLLGTYIAYLHQTRSFR